MKKILLLILPMLLLSQPSGGSFEDEFSRLFRIQGNQLLARRTNVTIGGGTFPITLIGSFGDSTTLNKLTVQGAAAFEDTIQGDIIINGAVKPQSLNYGRKDTVQTLVTFVFDDGNVTDSTIMKPVFNAQGEVACCAIPINAIGLAQRLSWTQIQTMAASGWEIISHGLTHADLTTISEDSIRKELTYSKQSFQEKGIKCNNFVYPYATHNALVRKLTREYYRSGRSAFSYLPPTYHRYNISPIMTYSLTAFPAEDHTLLGTYTAMVDTAIMRKAWIIFYLHATDSDDANTIGGLIDYIQSQNVSIVTIDGALNIMENIIDADDEFTVGANGNIEMGDTLYGPIIIKGTLNTTGGLKPGSVYWDLYQEHELQFGCASGANDNMYGSLQGATADSIEIDSMCIVWNTNQNDVYIDSMVLYRGTTRLGYDATVLYQNGTNYGSGTAAYAPASYILNITVSPNWRLRLRFYVATVGTAGAGYVTSAKVYGHYK